MNTVKAVCISKKKGTAKNNIGKCKLIEDFGLMGDAHAGTERQVSLLSYEAEMAFRERSGVDIFPGIFGENLLVSGYDFKKCMVGTRFSCGDVILEVTQIGKTCHTACNIREKAGDCIMPREGIFAKVIRGGEICVGDVFHILERELSAAVITASDRSFDGVREDKSGPLLCEILTENKYQVIAQEIISDDEELIYRKLISIADEKNPDVIFTTGGTGFSIRDTVPEATLRAAHRNAPGISEAIRANSMKITNRAMLSRAQSVIRNRTLIINLPGSPKAVKECLDFILPSLEHGIKILRGEMDG